MPGVGALAHIQGVPLVVHAVRGLVRSGCVDRVLVAGPREALAACSAAFDADRHEAVASTTVDPVGRHSLERPSVGLVTGGPNSVASARSALATAAPAPTDVVLLHEPTRPFTPPGTIRAVVAAVRAGAAAAVPVEPVTDTVKVADADGVVLGTRDREGLRRVQSPQGFLADVLRSAGLSDPLASLGAAVRTVPGHPHGMRVRTAFDITVLDALLTEDAAHAEEGTRGTP